MSEAWTPPPGMTIELLHGRGERPADVALVTLAPGEITPWESHADAAEALRIMGGCLCVEVETDGGVLHVGLSEVGRRSFTVQPGERHRLVNPYRGAPAVFVVVMKCAASEGQ